MRYIGTISKYFHFPYEGMYGNSGIEYIEKTVTGNGYVDLLTAKSGSLSNLTLFGGTEQRNVPEGYTELDYLRNVSNATKFDTGLKPLVGDELEIVRAAGTTSQSNYLLQSRISTNAGIWGISGSQNGGTIIASWGNGQSIVSNITRTEGHKYYTKMSVTATTLTLTVKDLTDNSSNTKNSSITAEDGVSNYFIRGNGIQFLTPPQNVYYARISNNGVDRIRLIPAKQGDTVGFYDMVSNTFMSTFVGDTPTSSTEEATANPYAPINIVSNNGVLKASRNLFDISKAIRGDIASIDGSINTTISYRLASDFIPVLAGQSYTASGKICFEELPDEYNIRLITAFYDSNKGFITGSRIVRQGELTFEIPTGTYYVRVEYWGDPAVGNTVDTTRSKLQFELGTTETNYMPYSQIYTDGTTETITDNLGNTATAEMLLKLGDLVDTQEVLSGNVTRKIGIKVFDGTETLEEAVSVGGRYRYTLSVTGISNQSAIAYGTHFTGGKLLPELNSDTTITQAVSVYQAKLRFYTTTYETLSDFTSFLASQYANGTPVITIYPLATETTETVDGQTLNVKRGTNKIEITQASIDDLGMSATYLSRE